MMKFSPMPKIPRDIKGSDLAGLLRTYGYEISRQTGSHIRLSRVTVKGEEHLTILAHSSLKIGTLNAILIDVAENLEEFERRGQLIEPLSSGESFSNLFGMLDPPSVSRVC